MLLHRELLGAVEGPIRHIVTTSAHVPTRCSDYVGVIDRVDLVILNVMVLGDVLLGHQFVLVMVQVRCLSMLLVHKA